MKKIDIVNSKNAYLQGLLRKSKTTIPGKLSNNNQPFQQKPNVPLDETFRTFLEVVDKKIKSEFTVVVDGVQIQVNRKPKSIKIEDNRVTIDLY